MINNQSAQCSMSMHLIRLLILECLKFNIAFKASHIPGVKNELADALSRFQMQRFKALAPQAKLEINPLSTLSQVW